jgi:hypothetical protein
MNIHTIIESSNDCEEAVIKYMEFSEHDAKLRRKLYLFWCVSFFIKFGKAKAMSEIYSFATFDMEHEDSGVRKAAALFEHRYLTFTGMFDFERNIEKDNAAGFTDCNGRLLYLFAPCHKPNSAKYQLTCFGKGRGPLSDSLHHSVEQLKTSGFITTGCFFLSMSEITQIENNYYPT